MSAISSTSRPRVLILSAYYFPFQGGSETHARSVAIYLARHGFHVVIVTKHHEDESLAIEEIDGITVHRVPPRGPRTGLRKWAMIPFALKKILSLKREFDLIYCPGYQGIGIAGILAGRWLKRPVVLRSGNLGVLMGDQWDAPLTRWHISPHLGIVRWMKRRFTNFYKQADAIACNCRDNETEALSAGVPRERVYYLPNSVDTERYRPAQGDEKARIRAEQGWRQDAQLCFFVGRLSTEKGVLDLLTAWRDIGNANRILVIIGPDMPGPLNAGPAARRFVSSMGMQPSVIFQGASVETARLLRAADAYVQPSHYESFSNALIEAMATGLPVVASRVGGMRDCIVDGENGLFANPEDAGDLARKLRTLLDNPGLSAGLGAKARKTMVDQFAEPLIMERFAELFEKQDQV
ncbi:MAG TPA: glycosyltransferase family 4 protein [Vicinamibacterales bacterium]|nr:glycosyltransferase family 4 protein [Vicinamibacterales bacterium]